MNKKNYGITPYYDFLTNQRQICTILILSIICMFFLASRINKAAGDQKNSNLDTEQTNKTSSFQYIPPGCGTHTPVLGPEGLYSITTNPRFTRSQFQSMGDHTTEIGNMMIVNGAPAANAIGIVNQNTEPNGNDFALDDIVFAPVCRNSIVVNLNPNPLKPSITPL